MGALNGSASGAESPLAGSRQLGADLIILAIPVLLLIALVLAFHELYAAVDKLKKSLQDLERRLARVEQRESGDAER